MVSKASARPSFCRDATFRGSQSLDARGWARNATHSPANAQPPFDAALAALAREQHAVFELRQLVELGLSASGIRKRVAAGACTASIAACTHWFPRSCCRAASLHGDGPRLRAGRRALASLGRGAARAPAHAASADRSHRSGPLGTQSRGDRGPSLDDAHAGRHHAATEHSLHDRRAHPARHRRGDRPRSLERAFDQAEILEVFDLRALDDRLERNPTRPGTGRVRAVLVEHYIGQTLTWSELEERFLKLIRAAGIPDPEVNAGSCSPTAAPRSAPTSCGGRSG